MKLITEAIKKSMPKLGSGRHNDLHDLTFYVKLFTPWANWTWYIAEADFETGECFGLVIGFEKEVGYFSLNELAEIRGWGGLKIERDRYFKKCTYAEAMKAESSQRELYG